MHLANLELSFLIHLHYITKLDIMRLKYNKTTKIKLQKPNLSENFLFFFLVL